VNSGDVRDIGPPNESFEAVFNFAVLHHVPDGKAAVDDIARVLVVGGIFFSQDHDVANHDWLSRYLFRHPPDRFTNAEFLAQLAVARLDVIGLDDRPARRLVVARKAG
jgi:SAM-dependent methyltransferase